MSTAEFVRRWPGSERLIALLDAVDDVMDSWGADDSDPLYLALLSLRDARDAMQSPPPPRAKPEHRHR